MALLGSVLITLLGCKPVKGDEIKFAANIAKTSLLLYVADERHLFEKNGLIATIKMNPSGPVSLKDLEEGKADVACVWPILPS